MPEGATSNVPIAEGAAGERRRRLDKRMPLGEAVGLVADGADVAIGGCLYSRTPWAMLLEILRAGRRDLTLARSLMCYEAELFLARGAATKLVTSWVGIGLPWGIPKVFRRSIEEGRATYEEWSHLALGLRFQAAAMGVPFLPTTSMLGSDLLPSTGSKEMDCPFTGERLCLVPAYIPDVALIHVQRADARGDAQIDGPLYMDREIAGAARCVILTAEEIVSEADIVARADRTVIPHFLVDAVVEVPFGSYPHECYGRYEASFEHFQDYVDLVKRDGEEGVRAYLKGCVDDAGSFAGFLEQIGVSTLIEQGRRARELAP
jgi:glutaconate CoA-transferase subunit A